MGKWHRHYHKRTNWKTKIVLLVIILVFFGYYTGALKLDLEKLNLEEIKGRLDKKSFLETKTFPKPFLSQTITDFSNLDTYNQFDGEKIKVRGILHKTLNPRFSYLEDSQGYKLEHGCINDYLDRVYIESEKYTAEGILQCNTVCKCQIQSIIFPEYSSSFGGGESIREGDCNIGVLSINKCSSFGEQFECGVTNETCLDEPKIGNCRFQCTNLVKG